MAKRRLIDLDVAMAKIRDEGILGEGHSEDERIKDVCDMLEDCPIVESEEVVHAYWRDDTFCSRCGGFSEDFEGHIIMSFSDYCPACGARMDEKVGAV